MSLPKVGIFGITTRRPRTTRAETGHMMGPTLDPGIQGTVAPLPDQTATTYPATRR